MRVPDEIRKCVVFLGTVNDQGIFRPLGTGFFVTIPSAAQATTMYVYLVTAKHVALRLGGHPFFAKINLTAGGSTFLHGRAEQKWYYHPTDASADVAIIPYAPDIS